MKLRCAMCGGNLVDDRVPYASQQDGVTSFVSDVPAKVCEQCGEVWFDDTTIDRLETQMKSLTQLPVSAASTITYHSFSHPKKRWGVIPHSMASNRSEKHPEQRKSSTVKRARVKS